MKDLLGLPLWLWVVFGLGVLAAGVYYARDLLGQRRARRAIDNVISSVAFEELRNVLVPTGTGEQIHVQLPAADAARTAGDRPVRRRRA